MNSVSIRLSAETLAAMDAMLEPGQTRSELVELAVLAFAARSIRERIDARDREIIDRNADRLNAEAEDVLRYQISW